MDEHFEIGDIINLCVGKPERVIPVEVVALNPDTGMPAKLKAVTPSESLIRFGFFQEGDDYFHSEHAICRN
jgi:hypothetical protein